MNDPVAIQWMRDEARKLGYSSDKKTSVALGHSKEMIANRICKGTCDISACLAIVSDLNFIQQGKKPHALADLAHRRRSMAQRKNKKRPKKERRKTYE